MGMVCTIFILSLKIASSLSLQATGTNHSSWPCLRRNVRNTGQADWKMPDSAQSWIYETQPPVGGEAKIFASPVLGENGVLYQGASHLYALDAATGKKKWQVYAESSLFQGSPALDEEGTLYVGCDDTYLYALSTKKGELRWKTRTGGPVRSSPALSADGGVYVGSGDRLLYALNRRDGSKR